MSTSGAPLTKHRTTGRSCFVGHLVERRHELVLGIERNLGDTREARAGVVDADAALLREHDQRAFGRVTDQRLAVEASVRAQRHRQHDLVEGELSAAVVQQLAPACCSPRPVTV